MNWDNLLNSQRIGDTRKDYDVFTHRSAFQRDFDRIVFSSSFRRMQDKTQVFPVPESDFVHNRLTHSLEVAMVGRSLGNLAGEYILSLEPELTKNHSMNMFGDIVAAAALAHDLGNPPFGHSGEKAIGDYFQKNTDLKDKFDISDLQWNDLLQYEGNAQGFRLLTNHHPGEMKGGMRLTYSTLATFAKYPRLSLIDKTILIDSEKKRTSSKKFSFFSSEAETFKNVAENIGLKNLSVDSKEKVWTRHPLAFLVEAADNICYRIIDLEDGFKLGYLTISEMEDLLIPLLLKANDGETAISKYKAMTDLGEKVGYLRAKSINVLVYEVMEVFKNNYSQIMTGDFDTELTDLIDSVGILEGNIKKSNIYLYNRKPVIEIELAGYQVIYGLLERFMKIHIEPNHIISKKMAAILPPQFLAKENESGYCKIMKIVDYVARMTDTYALNLYRRLSGQSLPSI
jgi:dGTPase